MGKPTIREARPSDIGELQRIRRAVTENVLSDPSKVTDALVEEYLTERGKGWVAEAEGTLLGFAIADLQDNNIWALFIDPKYENMGIGKRLHDTMLHWYFRQGKASVWLSTGPGTRAEGFYRKHHWEAVEVLPNGEVKFEMTRAVWLERQS